MGGLFADDDFENEQKIEDEVDSLVEEDFELTPRSNPDFFGHEQVEKQLLNDYNSGRLPHSIILSGANGIGKATLAFRLARFLFSQSEENQSSGLFGEPEQPESLYVSPDNHVFSRVLSAGHADLLVIEREFDDKRGRLKNDISVESIRRIHPFMRKTAAEGGWRVVIVDGAECLNRSSQNALLKILEEPPKNSLLILTTSQPGAFLPTIRSRCRMINMKPLEEGTVSLLLDKIVSGLESDEKSILIQLSEGSIGKAVALYEEEGISLYKQLLEIISTIPHLDMVKVHDLAEKIGRHGTEHNYHTAMDIMTLWCERQARALARGKVLQDTLPGDAAIFEKLVSAYPAGHFLKAWEEISSLTQQVEQYNLDKRQAVIGAFLALQKPDYKGLAL